MLSRRRVRKREVRFGQADRRPDYGRCVWFTAETTIDCDTEAAFERDIGITHPLCEILAASPEPCLIALTGFDRYSPRAQRLAHRWMQTLVAQKGSEARPSSVDLSDRPAPKFHPGFIEVGLPEALHRTMPLDLPSADDVQSLVAPISELQWASLWPESFVLLTNLENSTGSVAATRSGKAINSAVDHQRQLSDGRAMGALGRGRYGPVYVCTFSCGSVLEGEGDTLAAPRMQLEQSEQAALGSPTSRTLCASATSACDLLTTC